MRELNSEHVMALTVSLQAVGAEGVIMVDIDPDQARVARKRLLDQLASERVLFAGAAFLHLAFDRVKHAASKYYRVQG